MSDETCDAVSAAQTQVDKVWQCLCRPPAGQQCYHGIMARTPSVDTRVGNSSAPILGRQCSGGSTSSGGSVRTQQAGSDDISTSQELAETVWNMFATITHEDVPDPASQSSSSDLSNTLDGSSGDLWEYFAGLPSSENENGAPKAAVSGLLMPVQAPLTTRNKRIQALETTIASSSSEAKVDAARTALLKLQQRDTHGFYKHDFAFPGQESCAPKMLTDERALEAVQVFDCSGIRRCPGGCCKRFTPVRTTIVRMELGNLEPDKGARSEWLEARLFAAWDRSTARWGKLSIHLSPTWTEHVCPAAFGLIHGFNGSELHRLVQKVESGTEDQAEAVQLRISIPSVGGQRERADLAATYLRGYVYEHMLHVHEQSPAPGAARSTETVMKKRSYTAHWDDCKAHFRKAGREAPGTRSLLKRIIKRERRLHQKTVNSHPRCNTCVMLSAKWSTAQAMRGTGGTEARRQVAAAVRQHEDNHMGERGVLDQAAYRALVDPRRQWVILADAATKSNFNLPKLNEATPKDLVNAPFFSFKLSGTFAPGFGFTPYLCHDSSVHGSNLVWTTVWDTICRMERHYGFTADELFILLDNTTADNKNKTMLGVCGWLVSSGKFKRVRVFFLMVGHTHVIIDQIFGVITVSLRGKELMLPNDLITHINNVLSENPQYQPSPCQWLRTVFDWSSFITEKCGGVSKDITGLFRKINTALLPDGQVNTHFNGMHDMVFLLVPGTPASHVYIMYRKSSKAAWLPSNAPGRLVLTHCAPFGTAPAVLPLKFFQQWALTKAKKKQARASTAELAANQSGKTVLASSAAAWHAQRREKARPARTLLVERPLVEQHAACVEHGGTRRPRQDAHRGEQLLRQGDRLLVRIEEQVFPVILRHEHEPKLGDAVYLLDASQTVHRHEEQVLPEAHPGRLVGRLTAQLVRRNPGQDALRRRDETSYHLLDLVLFVAGRRLVVVQRQPIKRL